jgi:hypothetical protein
VLFIGTTIPPFKEETTAFLGLSCGVILFAETLETQGADSVGTEAGNARASDTPRASVNPNHAARNSLDTGADLSESG